MRPKDEIEKNATEAVALFKENGVDPSAKGPYLSQACLDLLAELERVENLAMQDDCYRCVICERVFYIDDMELHIDLDEHYCKDCFQKVPLRGDHLSVVKG